MASRSHAVTTFEPEKIIQPIYTGGDVALDRQARVLATCLGDEALLTDLRNGAPLARIEGVRWGDLDCAYPHADSISSNSLLSLTVLVTVAVDDTATLFATGSTDGAIKVWDINGGYVTHTFRGQNGVISALVFFVTGEPESDVQGSFIDKKRQKKSRKNIENGSVDRDALKIHLASGSEDGKIRIWNLAKSRSVAALDSHVSVVRALEFSSSRNILLSGSRDKTVILWDTLTWKADKVIPVFESIESVGFIGHTLIYTGGETGRIRLWQTSNGREVTEEQQFGSEGDGVVQILQNPFLECLLCVRADQSLTFYSTSSLSGPIPSESTIKPLSIFRRISGTHDEIIDLAYATTQRSLLALATNSEDIRLVLLEPQGSESSSPPAASSYFGSDVALLKGHGDIIICLDVDWSGCWLATGAKDNTARLWRIDHTNGLYEQYAIYTGHAESIGAISLPAQPPPLGSGAHSDPLSNPPAFMITGSQDKTIKRWSVPKLENSTSGKDRSRALYTRKAHDKDINAISINSSSTLFASASQDRLVKIWSTEEGEAQGVLRGHRRGVWSVRFAQNDMPNISGTSGPASARQGLVLTGSGDRTVKIWSLSDYSCIRTLEGHTNSVLKVLWLPPPVPSDSTATRSKYPVQIASAGGDGLIKIWDANTGETACTLDNHSDRIWALTVNPENRMLVSGGGDSIVTFWKDTTSSTLAATAAASTARVEQEQQLQNYIHRNNYREAITLALSLNHPGRLLSLFQTVANHEPAEDGSLSGLKAVDEVIASLADEQLLELLKRVRDWNTNARTAAIAQRILNVVIRSYPSARLAAMKGKGWKEMVDALRAYTERHYQRVEELIDESYLVEYTLGEMEEIL
ncbi:MAG: hypothetical protein Q9167_000773 [Letrouitia subvulpina]